MNGPRFMIALAAGKLCAAFCKTVAPGRGSNMPGAIALKFDPLFLRHLGGADHAKTVFITGTNGKSTVNNMVVHALRSAGHTVCSNIEGANMQPGVATALIKNTTASGRLIQEYMVFEIDERSLPIVAKDLLPGHLCITNIQKDQVQRNGDPDYIYQKFKTAIASLEDFTLYVNNDEPRAKSLGIGIPESGRVLSYGVAKNARATKVEQGWGITMPCPICHDALVFTHYNIAGVGVFNCPSCGFKSAKKPDLLIDSVDYGDGVFTAEGETFRLAYPAAFFLYNYALSLCVLRGLGLEPGSLVQPFEEFINISGRMEDFTHSGKTIHYMRIKQENPETLQSALDTIAEEGGGKVLVLGPAVVDDIVPNYSNTFYTFDCNFEPLIKSGVERYICFGSTIGWDMANRLRYAGVPDGDIAIVDTDDDEKILEAIAACESDNIYLITWIKKYEKLKGRA
ncbi:MAG: MurT ligase domain-containing protein, partial [Clostridiales bacterium]|nr:MurT ligase domain-containing protein [Clostridiales bacterium]